MSFGQFRCWCDHYSSAQLIAKDYPSLACNYAIPSFPCLGSACRLVSIKGRPWKTYLELLVETKCNFTKASLFKGRSWKCCDRYLQIWTNKNLNFLLRKQFLSNSQKKTSCFLPLHNPLWLDESNNLKHLQLWVKCAPLFSFLVRPIMCYLRVLNICLCLTWR